jgi:hypothetical protein
MPALAARRRTFGEEAIVARLGVLAQEPAIAKVVVALDQLDAVPAPQTELVGAAGQELVCGTSAVLHGGCITGTLVRTTTSWSPGLHCSVWDRCMVATATMWWRGAVWGQDVGQSGQAQAGVAQVIIGNNGGSCHHVLLRSGAMSRWAQRKTRTSDSGPALRGLPKTPLCEGNVCGQRVGWPSEDGAGWQSRGSLSIIISTGARRALRPIGQPGLLQSTTTTT